MMWGLILTTVFVCVQGQFGNNYSGFINVNASRNHNLFYWAFESQNSISDPVVLWLNGGPGASSILFGLLNENGPFTIEPDLNGYKPNPYSWNKVANVIWLDQPVGVGFSYSDYIIDDYEIYTYELMQSVDTFLRKFLLQYPAWNKGQEFYIFAESYGGHYGPALSSVIIDNNKNGSRPLINLKGLGLGNAWVDPIIQLRSYITFSQANGLINSFEATVLEDLYASCVQLIKNKEWVRSAAECYGMVGAILLLNPGMEIYDIRKKCPGTLNHDCYNFTAAEDWLNLPSTNKLLHANGRVPNLARETPDGIIAAVNGDESSSHMMDVKKLLDNGGRVLVYNGDFDFMCNWIGGNNWTSAMRWSGQNVFNKSPMKVWKAKNATTAGWVKQMPNLQFQFIKLHNSGHLVPFDQPANALQMFSYFLKNQSLV